MKVHGKSRRRSNGGAKRQRPAPRGMKLQPRIVVKFRDFAEPLAPSFGEQFPGLRLEPLFRQSPEQLRTLVDRGAEMDPSYRPVDLASYFAFEVPRETDAEALAKRLSSVQAVERAYVEPGPVEPPLVNASDDPRWVDQGYLDPSPDGIDAEFAWTVPGGAGAGTGFVDLEWGWALSHEDLAAHGISLISGINHSYFSHGTSVLGEVASVDNTVGCVGITPEIGSVRVVSQWLTGGGYSTSQPILDAIAVMNFGDVLLLEAQTSLWGYTLVPVEIEPAVFDVIRLATALGIVVVEAAGNGGVDLDTVVDPLGNQVFNRTAGPSAGFQDSGAILVGAASSAAPHTRLGFSCHGSRIDCYGWGQNVETAATNSTGTALSLYTSSFNGTSSASPIVTGAALSTQGMAMAALGYRYGPWQLRVILSDPATGTASANPAVDRIGVMPNLRAIAEDVLNVVPDIYLRDHVGDTGEPHTGPISASPDIILRPDMVADPEAAFGEASGTANDVTLGYEAEAGQDNFLYVRARNRGGAAAANVTATLYWSEVATLVTPDLWNLIGSVVQPALPTGDVLTVFPQLVWPSADIPATGHYCMVGLIGSATDPAPAPADFMNFDNFRLFIRENNNVTWRNFNVVNNEPDMPPGFVTLPFLVTGAPDRARPMALEAVGRLPREARVFLEVPLSLAQRMDLRAPQYKLDEKRRLALLPLKPAGRTWLGEWLFPAKMRTRARLRVSIPEPLRQNPYEFAIRQLYRQEEVGRITWRLTPERRRGGKARKGR